MKTDPTKHTPGPWFVPPDTSAVPSLDIVAGPFPEALLPYELVVATVNSELRKWRANQLLIATAPELLEFARKFLDSESTTADLDREAKRLIAKATGQNL